MKFKVKLDYNPISLDNAIYIFMEVEANTRLQAERGMAHYCLHDPRPLRVVSIEEISDKRFINGYEQ